MLSLEYGQKAHAIDEACFSGIEQCGHTARRLLSALVVGVMALAMANLIYSRMSLSGSGAVPLLIKLVMGVYVLMILIGFSRVHKTFYFIKSRYHKDMMALYEQCLADDAAKAAGAVIKPSEIERYDNAVIDWKSSVTVPVTLLLCALLLLPYYYVDTHTEFTPKGWTEYNMRWRPYMVQELAAQQTSHGWGGQFNLYRKTSAEIKEMFYEEEYAHIPVDFTAKDGDGKYTLAYNAYYLYTDGDGRNHWLVVNGASDSERILFLCTGDVCHFLIE